jgi:hypothetical protein
MAKFNLKNYKKTDGDEHTDLRLEEHRGNIPEQISEAQLEDYHADEQDQTTEKQLEKVRTGEADRITEGRLEKEDGRFDIKHRNEATYSGDMNKLEEKRLNSDPVEKEKYELASEVNNKMRWWEGTKSPDGLKLASKITKEAQVDTEEAQEVLEETLIPQEEGEGASDTSARIFNPWEEAFKGQQEATDPERVAGRTGMTITNQKILTGKIPGIYMTLEFDPAEFGGNEGKIRREALREVLAVMPELGGLIDDTDFYNIDDEAGTLKLRAAGDKFEILNPPVEGELDVGALEGPNPKEMFSELSYEEKDVGGTIMAIGKIKTIDTPDKFGKDMVINKAVDFIEVQHPDLLIDKNSLDLSNITNGEIGFMVAAKEKEQPEEEISAEELEEAVEPEVGEEFPISEVTAQSKTDIKKN